MNEAGEIESTRLNWMA